MESDHSKYGNAYQIFLVFGLFLCGSLALVFLTTAIYHFIRIDSLEMQIEALMNESVPDLALIERSRMLLELLKDDLLKHMISMFASSAIFCGFFILEIVYLRAKREPFRQKMSASERIKKAQKNQSRNIKENCEKI